MQYTSTKSVSIYCKDSMPCIPPLFFSFQEGTRTRGEVTDEDVATSPSNRIRASMMLHNHPVFSPKSVGRPILYFYALKAHLNQCKVPFSTLAAIIANIQNSSKQSVLFPTCPINPTHTAIIHHPTNSHAHRHKNGGGRYNGHLPRQRGGGDQNVGRVQTPNYDECQRGDGTFSGCVFQYMHRGCMS